MIILTARKAVQSPLMNLVKFLTLNHTGWSDNSKLEGSLDQLFQTFLAFVTPKTNECVLAAL